MYRGVYACASLQSKYCLYEHRQSLDCLSVQDKKYRFPDVHVCLASGFGCEADEEDVEDCRERASGYAFFGEETAIAKAGSTPVSQFIPSLLVHVRQRSTPRWLLTSILRIMTYDIMRTQIIYLPSR